MNTESRAKIALQQRIRRQYHVVTEDLQIGAWTIPLTRVSDPDQVFQRMETVDPADAADPRWQPYWAQNWDSAWVVACHLADLPLRDQHVLDLGCGLGLTGAVAAAAGAHVVLADAAPPALLFARLNTWPWRQRASVRRLDWRNDSWNSELFSLIVGSDILYQPTDWPYLESFWRRHLDEAGMVLLGEPGRRSGDAFPDWLEERGWHVCQLAGRSAKADTRIRLFEARPDDERRLA